jgi:hypothetical protein
VPVRAESKPWDLIRIMPAWESETPVESRISPCSPANDADIMEIYSFAQHMLAWSVTVAVLGFVTFPWLMLAYKIWHGNKPIDEDLKDELLIRSWFAGWALGAAAIVFVVLDYVTAYEGWLGLPAGPMHVVFVVGFLGLSAWWMMYFFSMEDFFQGLSLAVIYLYVPTALLFLLSLLFDNPLQVYVLKWLVEPKV